MSVLPLYCHEMKPCRKDPLAVSDMVIDARINFDKEGEKMGIIISDLIVNLGLYQKVAISKDDIEELELFINGKYQFDAYCIECEKDSPFNVIMPPSRNIGGPSNSASMSPSLTGESKFDIDQYNQRSFDQLISNNKFVVKVFACSRNNDHRIIIQCIISDKSIMKYGQYPSYADLNQQDISKYRKILKDRYVEFSRANGLYSHGIGIGSFVYLRRIFEELIEEAHLTAKKNSDWDENQYINKRMNERIGILRDFLPSFLVNNEEIYGILSKGIHELEEEECKGIYPVVKAGIELILDEKIAEIEKANKIKDVTHSLDIVREKIARRS